MDTHPPGRDATPPDPSPSRYKAQLSPRALPLYRVVLLRNADKDLMFIVRTVMELTRFCKSEATHRMWQAYHDGKSVLAVTYKERAELFAELFADRGLAVAIEPS